MAIPHNKTVQEALDVLAVIVDGLSGIRQAFEEPPDQLVVFPAALMYAGGGREEYSKPILGQHTLICEIHYSRKDMTRAVQALMPYIDLMMEALWTNWQLSGAVTEVRAIDYAMEWDRTYNSVETVALVFSIEVNSHRG